MDNLELLQKSQLFKGSSRDELDAVVGMFQERHVRENSAIFAEKMAAEALYLIKDGKVRITIMEGEGKEAGLLLLGPGDFFGELALVHDDVRLVNARAETAVEFLLLTRKDFQVLLEIEPRAAARALTMIAKLLAKRIQTYQKHLREMLLT
jgi:CRP/FNR family transcriptional regulator, cyclic AMP receptor protein